MAMLEMLAEMVGTEEFLRLIAFDKFMLVGEMCSARIPIRLWIVRELIATIAACIKSCNLVGWRRWRMLSRTIVRRGDRGRGVESIIVTTVEGGAGPVLLAKVNGILVTLCFVLVFEAIGAI